MASNYPLVELTSKLGIVSFATTSNWSSTGVATGTTLKASVHASRGPDSGYVQLDISPDGIASAATNFVVGPDIQVSRTVR